jgi:hypothetical protein
MSGPRVREFRGEEALLARFLAVSDPRRTVVCATQGHGEPALDSLEPYRGRRTCATCCATRGWRCGSPSSSRPEGLRGVRSAAGGGPAGAAAAGAGAGDRALRGGGGDLLLLAGAVILRGRSQLAPHGLEALTARYGVRFGERVVVDPSTMAGATPLLAFTLRDGWGDRTRRRRAWSGSRFAAAGARELVLEAPATR